MKDTVGRDMFGPVMGLGEPVTKLSSDLAQHGRVDVKRVKSLLVEAERILALIGLSLVACIHTKIEINSLKYPMGDTKKIDDGRLVAKHTFSVDEKDLITPKDLAELELPGKTTSSIIIKAFPKLEHLVSSFSSKRRWKYCREGLALSLRAEYGEVCGALEYVDLETVLNHKVVSKLAMEMADLCIYLIHCCRLLDSEN